MGSATDASPFLTSTLMTSESPSTRFATSTVGTLAVPSYTNVLSDQVSVTGRGAMVKVPVAVAELYTAVSAKVARTV